MVVAGRVKKIIQESGLSLPAFSRRTHVSKNTLINYRDGASYPNAEFLATVCQEFGINPQWLLLGTGPMKASWGDELFTPPDSIVSARVDNVTSPPESQPVEGARPAPGPSPPDLQGIRISDALQATARVLESGTSYAVALFLNIQHFDRAVQAETRIADLEQLAIQHKARITELDQVIEDQSRMVATMQEVVALSECKISDLQHIVKGQNDDISALRQVISTLQEQIGEWGRKPRDSIQRDGTEEEEPTGSAGAA